MLEMILSFSAITSSSYSVVRAAPKLMVEHGIKYEVPCLAIL